MKFFSRVDKIVGAFASLGVPKSEGDVNRKLIRVLTADYDIERRTLLNRDEITREEIENIVRQMHLRLPVSKGKNVGQALFSNSAARVGRGGGRGGSRGGGRRSNRKNVSRKTRDQRMLMLARVTKVAAAPHPQADHPPIRV